MLICPKCKNNLIPDGKSYRCKSGHCYDVAKKGYVNLLMSQSSKSRHHGDDKLMAAARRDFLDTNSYRPLVDCILKHTPRRGVFADIGCGECWYLCNIRDERPDLFCVGIDISKEILEVAGARTKPRGILTAVASGSALPFADGSLDALLSVFAPISEGEFHRVLKRGGKIIRVTPDIDHLFELKAAVYDVPRKNDPLDMALDGFDIVNTESLRFSFTVDKTGAKNLFAMTPYYYKTSQTDRQKLNSLNALTITAAFVVTVYEKC